jgi:putative transposase
MQRTFKYRLYPNRQQRETLAAQLDLCRELYNAALQERIASYKTTRKSVTWLQQQSQLPAIKEVRPEFKSVHAHTLQAVLIRLNRSFSELLSSRQEPRDTGVPEIQRAQPFQQSGIHAHSIPGARPPCGYLQGWQPQD